MFRLIRGFIDAFIQVYLVTRITVLYFRVFFLRFLSIGTVAVDISLHYGL